MSARLSWVLVIVVAVAALMLLPGGSGIGSATDLRGSSVAVESPGISHALAPSASSPGLATMERLKAALNADHVPASEQLLPSAAPAVSVHNGMITPGSNEQPQPIGIADYGISEHNGHNVASVSYTRGVEGVLTLNSLDLQYLDSIGPDEYTAQLNSVAVGVTLQKSSVYQFWTQNVFYYYQSSHTLHLADAIVNFSSPALNVPYGALIGGNGFLDPGFGYFYPNGPAIYAPEPFTIAFFANLSVVNHHQAVYFNYSVTSRAGSTGGSFDMVEFNSTVAKPTPPAYQIDGNVLGDTGYIPNDVELILGGDGGGSTATVYGINGTMNLYIQHNGSTTFFPVPAAYDFGGETGETMEGISEWASGGPNPTVHLGTGPFLQQPLWGVKGAPAFGSEVISFHVSPANAFLFASLGTTFNQSAAGWGSIPPNGVTSIQLPVRSYSFQFLLSNYDPVTRNNAVPGQHAISLTSDPSMGIYTPLWAHGNSELAAISEPGGLGTINRPYVLMNGPKELLNPLFGEFNDYMFPVFSGVFLWGTTAHVTITDESTFEVPFTLPGELFYSNVLPLSDELGYWFYAAANASVVSNPAIGGWFSYAVYGGASIVMWNSSHDLFAGNGLPVASVGMYEFGGTTNVIWGNVFSTAIPSAPDPGYLLNYGNPVALDLFESGDLIYNNVFATPQTAFTPPYNPYDFYSVPEVWHDLWNVHYQPATDVRMFNGFDLSGSILGLSYEGGNYWSNYGSQRDPYGILPYDNGGNIGVGGDHVPLLTVSLYQVKFRESGLPSGTAWSVTLNGITESSTSAAISFWDPNGAYAFTVGSVAGHTPSPSLGAVQVNGVNQRVAISWT
jgi:thermopsin